MSYFVLITFDAYNLHAFQAGKIRLSDDEVACSIEIPVSSASCKTERVINFLTPGVKFLVRSEK
jgi:hypothetical protein